MLREQENDTPEELRLANNGDCSDPKYKNNLHKYKNKNKKVRAFFKNFVDLSTYIKTEIC